MRAKDSEQIVKQVCHSYANVFHRDRKKMRDHFVRNGMHPRSINPILDRYEERGNADFKKSTGRPLLMGTKKVVKIVEKAFINNPNISERAVATKVKLSKSYVHQIKGVVQKKGHEKGLEYLMIATSNN